jgi:hypothetical protein
MRITLDISKVDELLFPLIMTWTDLLCGHVATCELDTSAAFKAPDELAGERAFRMSSGWGALIGTMVARGSGLA